MAPPSRTARPSRSVSVSLSGTSQTNILGYQVHSLDRVMLASGIRYVFPSDECRVENLRCSTLQNLQKKQAVYNAVVAAF